MGRGEGIRKLIIENNLNENSKYFMELKIDEINDVFF